MKCVGIIGGMGAKASVDLYDKITQLTPATRDQDHIHLIIDSYAQIEDRTSFILNQGQDPLPKLLLSANRLKNCGCDAIAIACNTAHFFADELEKQTGLKILHIAKIAISALINTNPEAKDIAVIATTGTQKGQIYEKVLAMYGLNSVQITDAQQEAIMSCIYKGVKAGKTEEFAPLFSQVLREIKADVFVAACTEIPLLLPHIKQDFKFIDATLELAKQIVKFAKS